MGNFRSSSFFVVASLLSLVMASSVVTANAKPLTDADFHAVNTLQAELGRLLFYDKILSGNRNISCGTCHHPAHGTSDGLSLGIGEGGRGVGPSRTAGSGKDRIQRRVPRNAPALWNLGALEIKTLMHDGRISKSDIYGNGFNTPAQEWLPNGLDSVLAAQALFPVASETEMAGSNEENEVAGAANDRIDNAWPIIAKRVRSIPAYAEQFINAFESIDRREDISIVAIGNALAAFINAEFRSTDSPYDRWLAGDDSAMTAQQRRGKDLFLGAAGCHTCHSGPLFSSHTFKALALPAFGPGRTRQYDPMPRDVGRMGETDRLDDAYRFRVPMLRNVALTAPYGHNGAYPSLAGMIRHHHNPRQARAAWTPALAKLPQVPWLHRVDFIIGIDKLEMQRQAAWVDIDLPAISQQEIADLVTFLQALSGDQAVAKNFKVPESVPSGLTVDNTDFK